MYSMFFEIKLCVTMFSFYVDYVFLIKTLYCSKDLIKYTPFYVYRKKLNIRIRNIYQYRGTIQKSI